MTDTAEQIPFADYLVLDDGGPHPVAHECASCGARYFDRRNACAGCFGAEFPVIGLGSARGVHILEKSGLAAA